MERTESPRRLSGPVRLSDEKGMGADPASPAEPRAATSGGGGSATLRELLLARLVAMKGPPR
jgi:hypothetical protein